MGGGLKGRVKKDDGGKERKKKIEQWGLAIGEICFVKTKFKDKNVGRGRRKRHTKKKGQPTESTRVK